MADPTIPTPFTPPIIGGGSGGPTHSNLSMPGTVVRLPAFQDAYDSISPIPTPPSINTPFSQEDFQRVKLKPITEAIVDQWGEL